MKLLFVLSFVNIFYNISADMTESGPVDEEFTNMIVVQEPAVVVESLKSVRNGEVLGKSTADVGFHAVSQALQNTCPAPIEISEKADMHRVNANEFARFRSCFMDKKMKAIKRSGRSDQDEENIFDTDSDSITTHDVHLQEYKQYVAGPWFLMHRFVCGESERCWLSVLSHNKCFSESMRNAMKRCARKILRGGRRHSSRK